MGVGLPFTPSRAAIYLIIVVVLLLGLFNHEPFFERGPILFVPSTYDWGTHPLKHGIPEENMTMAPGGNPLPMPSIQHDFASDPSDDPGRESVSDKRGAIKRAFRQTWASYEKHAWGRDELKPLSMEGQDTFGGWAASMIDALDTLWLMDMKSEFYDAVDYVASLDWNNSTSDSCNLFETNIRYLGGLLSAYDLSGEPVLLSKAIEIGNLLYVAFDNPEHMPPHSISFYDLKEGRGRPGHQQSSAGLGSMSLEFTRLSQLTGNPKYYDGIDRITRAFERTQNQTLLPGMWPVQINAKNTFAADDDTFSLGADGDSLYEYLVKEHVLLQGQEPLYEKMYLESMDVVINRLLFRPMLPDQDDLLMLGKAEVIDQDIVTLRPHLEHLSCFAGGMFALGGKVFGRDDHVVIGDKLARGCAHAYAAFPNGIMPEISSLHACPSLEPCDFRPMSMTANPPGFKTKDRRYILRPEAIESIFVLYRITGNNDFRDIAWAMWTAIKKATKTDDGTFAAIEDVTMSEPKKTDSMESFWLAETLKYFYLIFSDEDVISLDEWVFNTEGHPLKRSGST
ncbi:hypothetical protein QQX98_004022 [Neonectria punicea]|uniref:alpha-1,2-Mannosidase n=1 Tax=Neonectria punicea TaxID=979145 RepID=A0ABR1HAQ4_9HYPO